MTRPARTVLALAVAATPRPAVVATASPGQARWPAGWCGPSTMRSPPRVRG